MEASAFMEPTVKYHPYCVRILTRLFESTAGTVPAGQFDWGGFLNWGLQQATVVCTSSYMLERLEYLRGNPTSVATVTGRQIISREEWDSTFVHSPQRLHAGHPYYVE